VACGGFAAERSAGGTYRSSAAAQQQRRRSTALSSKCGQCHVDSRVDEAEHRVVSYEFGSIVHSVLSFTLAFDDKKE